MLLLLDFVYVGITVIGTAGYTIVDSDRNENETHQVHFGRKCSKSLPVLSSQYINPHLPRCKLFLIYIIISFLDFNENVRF